MFAGRLLHLEDIAVCASMGKSAISDLLVTGAALAWSAELEEDKAQWVEACVYIYILPYLSAGLYTCAYTYHTYQQAFIHVHIHAILISRPLYMCIYIPYLSAGLYTCAYTYHTYQQAFIHVHIHTILISRPLYMCIYIPYLSAGLYTCAYTYHTYQQAFIHHLQQSHSQNFIYPHTQTPPSPEGKAGCFNGCAKSAVFDSMLYCTLANEIVLHHNYGDKK